MLPKILAKRGRPRKYQSNEEKAQHDVISRRARRRLRASRKREQVRFKAYTAQQVVIDPGDLSHRITTLSHSIPIPSCNEISSDNSNLQVIDRHPPVITNSRPLNLCHSASTPPQDFYNTDYISQTVDSGSPIPGPLCLDSSVTDEMLQDANYLGFDDDQEFVHASLSQSARASPIAPTSADSINEQALEDLGCSKDAITEDGVPGHDERSAKVLVEGGESKNTSNQNEAGEDSDSDLDFLPDDAFETDSDSASELDLTVINAESNIEKQLGDTTLSDVSKAKDFLEKTWVRLCNCQGKEEICREPEFNLDQMADYWRDLGVPDSIDPTADPCETEDKEHPHLVWSSILNGGDRRPHLRLENSQLDVPSIKRTWDVDSIIAWASCLSINRGLYVSYFPPAVRNITADVHVFHQGKALHLIPHIRLGNGGQSPQFSVYIFFPEISHVCRSTSYLTKSERQLWVDGLLLPAIRRYCPPDVTQHHPQSFADIESKAQSRRRECCSGMVQKEMDMHHYLPQQYLTKIWPHMVQTTRQPEFKIFQGMFIVLSAKNLKLEARTLTFQECRLEIINHLHQVLDWSQADLSNTWIDIGLEDTAVSASTTLLLKTQCLESWLVSMAHGNLSPLLASERFNWNLTGQAGSARAETRKTHPLRKGGIAYGQRYNVNKELFATASKGGHGLFGEPHLEGMACPPSLLDAWIVAARQDCSAGLATSLKSSRQLQRIRRAFDAMKHRIHCALEGSFETSFGTREEYRISWDLFMTLDPSTAQPSGAHRPFWVLPTAHVNKFMRWEFNRWISAIEAVRVRGTRRDCSWEDHQRNMIMVTILLRSLKASVNCHHIARRSQMFKNRYKNRKGKPLLGLDFESSMQHAGLAWLPYDMFDWNDLHLYDELVTSTTFTFNGLQGVFRNWKDVEAVNREYHKARELEYRLKNNNNLEDRKDILGHMRKMVYQHCALQVIQQLDVIFSSADDNIEIQQGCHGLSFDMVHQLWGKMPYLVQIRNRRSPLGDSYSDRLQGLFSWDDGLPRTYWDHCYYRQLTRKFYKSILSYVDISSAELWKSSLGRHALAYFWIIPNYNKHSLFARLSKNAKQTGPGRPFISGVYQWKTSDNAIHLCDESQWSLGGRAYMEGCPENITKQDEPLLVHPRISPLTYMIDFGCDVPFTKIPQIIEEGFDMCQKLFVCGDRKVLAHYEAARDCLTQHLGDPLCDLLLMMVLTYTSSTVTPSLPACSLDFEAGPRKDPRLLAITLTTRMLWFLYPCDFPWDEDDGIILRIPEMVKKMGRSSHSKV